MTKTILAFGELLWDILPTATILGGAPFNFVYRVNSLGDRGLMVSRLGRDSLGQKALDKVVSLGLETIYLQWDDHNPTGTVQVSFDSENKPDYVIIPRVAYDHIEMNGSLRDSAPTVDCFCFGTLSQRSEESRKTLEKLIEQSDRSLKFLDINLRKDCYSKDTIIFSLNKADVLKLNEDEAVQLAQLLEISHETIPQFCEAILNEWSLQYCLVTLAEQGAFAFSHKDEKIYSPGYKINLADSLGAGDAFSAGFVHKILRGFSTVQACEYGNTLGALVATTDGATYPITQDEMDQFLHQKLERNIYFGLEQFMTN